MMATAIEANTFYHDEGLGMAKRDNVKAMKRSMTLDLNSGPKTKQQKFASLLSSPDINMLKLASPELEKMIIAQNGMITTTPTPTQFICPKFVTEEQEAYAKGFVDALNELHQSQHGGGNTTQTGPAMALGGTTPGMTYATLTTVSSNPQSLVPRMITTATTSLPGNTIPRLPPVNGYSRLMTLKEEPQIVPCMDSTPPLSPINMDHQEGIKLERKRARNRVAASKCRTRKLERISRLEDRVSELKGQNTTLTDAATKLREQVFQLKQQIMEHVNSGCQVMLSSNITL